MLGGSNSPSLANVLRQFDKNGDGKVSMEELRLSLQGIGEDLSPEEAEAVLESLDSDGDGLLELDDLVKLLEVRDEDEDEDEDVRAAFKVYEMEGVGQITAPSLQRTLSRLGNSTSIEECEAMIVMFDLDGDGMLSLQEFKLMIMHS